MIYTIHQSVVREKNGRLNDRIYEGESLECSSESLVKAAIKQLEEQNPEWKRIKNSFIPKKRWAYIEITVYREKKLFDVYYYYI